MVNIVSHVVSFHLKRKGLTHTDLFFFLGAVVSSSSSKKNASIIIVNANPRRLRLTAAILIRVCLVFDPKPDPDASQSNAKLARCKTDGIYFASAVLRSAWRQACQFQAAFLCWQHKLDPTQTQFLVKYGLKEAMKWPQLASRSSYL